MSPGLALPGPHSGARPGIGICRQAPWVCAQGMWLGIVRNAQLLVGSPPACGLGGSRGRRPRRRKEPELVREFERYRPEIVGPEHTALALEHRFLRVAGHSTTLESPGVSGGRLV